MELKQLAANALPIVGGIAGGTLGSVVPGAGTLVGGALGTGAGEFLRQRMLGEKMNAGRIVGEAALGVIPGVGMMGKAARARKLSGAKDLVRQRALKELSDREKRMFSEYGEHLLGGDVPNLNQTIRTARAIGNRTGMDVTSGSPRDVARRIEEAIIEAERLQARRGALTAAEAPLITKQLGREPRPLKWQV